MSRRKLKGPAWWEVQEFPPDKRNLELLDVLGSEEPCKSGEKKGARIS